MILLISACWTKVSGEIPAIQAQRWNERIVVESSNHNTLQIDVRAGYAHDPIGKEGLAWWTAHSLFPSTLSKTISVHPEYVRFRFSVPEAQQDEIIALISNSLQNPMWYPQDISRIRAQLLSSSYTPNELNELTTQGIFQQWLYSGHPYGHSPLGNIGSAETISEIDIQEFFEEYYTRSSFVFGWHGSPSKISLLDTLQDGLLSRPIHIPRYKTPVSLPSRQKRQTLLFHIPEIETSKWAFGIVFPNATSKLRVTALALQEYLCPTSVDEFLTVYDPIISCVGTAENNDLLFAAIEKMLLRYEAFFSLELEEFQSYLLMGINKQKEDPLSASSLVRMSIVDTSVVPPIDDIVAARKEMRKHHPQIMVLSPNGPKIFSEREDIFSTIVIRSQYTPFFLAPK